MSLDRFVKISSLLVIVFVLCERKGKLELRKSVYSRFWFYMLSFSQCCKIVSKFGICLLLHRYAYSGEGLDDEEEGLSLTGSTVIVGGDLSKLDRKERKASITADHVFGLGEVVLEEDKRA